MAGLRKGSPIVRPAGTDRAPVEPAAGGPPAGYREEVLRAMPSLRRLYARALGRLRTMVLARPVARGLPQVVLRDCHANSPSSSTSSVGAPTKSVTMAKNRVS